MQMAGYVINVITVRDKTYCEVRVLLTSDLETKIDLELSVTFWYRGH